MITEGRPYMLSGQWWVSVIPGIGVLCFVAIATACGDALANHLGVREVS
jgi:ABC-type dipeptide/oligopeptide/nickel transport system permease subunit